MPVRDPNRPLCRDCNGFAIVFVTTGERHRNGSRALLPVFCPGCQGTGYATPAVLARLGR